VQTKRGPHLIAEHKLERFLGSWRRELGPSPP